jgi:hypothetical protein
MNDDTKEVTEKQSAFDQLNTQAEEIISIVNSHLAKPIKNCPKGITDLLSKMRLIQWKVTAFKSAVLAPHFNSILAAATTLEDKLEKQCEQSSKIVENFSKEFSDFGENRRTRYDDAGEWARHYSTVRMTVATFALTTCVAIIALKGDESSLTPEEKIYMGNSVVILWLLGAVIFYVFSYLSYKQSNRQRKYRKDLPTTMIDSKNTDNRGPTSITRDFAWWAVTAITFCFGFFVETEIRQYIWVLLKLATLLLFLCGIIFPACMDDWIKKDVWKDMETGVKPPILDRVCDVLKRLGDAL